MHQTETFFEFPNFKNIKEIMEYSLQKYPDKIAFRLKEKKNTKIEYKDIKYKEFFEDVNNFGSAIYKLNLQNRRIAIISKNRYEWALSYVSILKGGMIAIPLDKDLTPIEIENSLIKSKAECIIYEEKYEEIIEEIQSKQNTNLKRKICMDNNYSEYSLYTYIEKGKKILESGDTEYLNAKIEDKELAVLVFTSGTTSKSKAVMLSQYNLAQNIYDMRRVEPLQTGDVNLAILPYHHTFGSTGQLIMLGCGITTVYCDSLKSIGKNLKEYHVTVLVGVPKLIELMYEKINEEIKYKKKEKVLKVAKVFTGLLLKLKIDIRRKVFKEIIDELGGLRFVINGAAALNKNVEKGFNDLGIFLIQGYGLTECSPVVAAENYKYRKYGSIGVPMPSVDVEIVNQSEDGIGEIRIKGPNVMLGYYEDEEKTNETLRNGWLYTGDLGYIDKKGYIFVAGRRKDMIVLKNGKKVFPEEMEELINSIELVDESFVFGMPKDDDLILSVEIKYNDKRVKEKYPNGLSQEELEKIIWEEVKQINKLVPNYKHIKNVIITKEDFIKTSTNKIKRFEEIKRVLPNQ